MTNSKELINFNDPKSIIEFLQSPAVKMAEFITGLLASDSKDYKLSAGRLVQASIKWKLFSQLGQEIRDYIAKGKIKSDYIAEDLCKQTLSEILKFIDEAAPDEIRFKAMKSLFMKSAFLDSDDEDKALSYQFMRICKDLESGHLLVLMAVYNINEETLETKNQELITQKGSLLINKGDPNVSRWLENISIKIGHGIPALVEVYEGKLIDLKLLTPRIANTQDRFLTNGSYRLTTLGLKFCEFIGNQESERSE